MLASQPSPKPCIHCGKPFLPQYTHMQIACSLTCAARFAKKQREAKEKQEKAQTRERKRAIRKLSEFRADAQKAFNEWVRLRDAHLACISCKTWNPPMVPGGQWDAGHFLSRGAYPELAFEPLNVWKQCKVCNAGSGKFAHKARTVAQKYEEELLRRIGPEKLAWLKGPHEPKKYTREDYEQIESTYRAKVKELKETA